MVKIRKKTSNRQSTAMRTKIARKSSEAVKKGKKASKKDVTWKSNKPKDIGIPSMFPFKDQVLAEVAAEKVRKEEEKIARREAQRAENAAGTGATLASTAALAQALAADSQRHEDFLAEGGAFEDDEENMVADPSLRLHARSLRKVLEASDVLIEVLDARDPVGTRCRAVERELKSLDGGRKKLVLVLNKIDLVPPPVVQAWLTHLRLQAPTLAFKSSTQQQRSHLSASSLHTPSSASGSSTKPLMELIKGFRIGPNVGNSSGATDQKVKQSLTIGLIGHPNVGKSSLINTLKRSKACSVAPTPGWTKEVQEVTLEKGVRVLDCPGVVVEARGETEGALRGMVRPEDVKDVRAPVELILQRCKKEHLMMLYNIPAFNGITEFLVEVARGKGRLKRGGIPDLNGTAISILRDWVSGRIPYYTSPPAASVTAAAAAVTSLQGTVLENVSDTDVNSSTLLTSFAPAFDLAALFGEADALAFGEMGVNGKGVKMEGQEEESEEANVGWITGEGSDIEEDDDEMEAEDGDEINVDDLLEEDDEEDSFVEGEVEDDENMEEDLIPALLAAAAARDARPSKRNAGGANIVSVAPTGKNLKSLKGKSVSFASKPLGPTAGQSQTAKLFGRNEDAPVSLNKDIKKNAKKAKKSARKEEERMDVEIDQVLAAAGTPKAAPSADGAYSFEEFFPTAGKTKGKKAKSGAMEVDE